MSIDFTNPPQFPKTLPGSFWGITTFFNPAKYPNKPENYHRFRESAQRQGLNLLTVELAFGKEPFVLTPRQDAEILIQVRSDSVLWQKERLINIGLKNLPVDCDKFAWLDADILFLNDNWIPETCTLLEKYNAVQPFKECVRLDKGQCSPRKSPEEISKTIRQDLLRQSTPYAEALCNPKWAHPGFTWAFRRKLFASFDFYDRTLIGSGDYFMARALYSKPFTDLVPKALMEDITAWQKKLAAIIRESIFYTEGTLLHLFHGSIPQRIHTSRYRVFHIGRFDPHRDLRLNQDHCLEWATQKPLLHFLVKEYFRARNETDSFLGHCRNLFFRALLKGLSKILCPGVDVYARRPAP